MSTLIFRAYFRLMYYHLYLARGSFKALYQNIQSVPVSDIPASDDAIDRVCAAMDMACVSYWKEVLCLQRSAATTLLLRKKGVPAQMVIGVQQLPFRAHAWVEVEGRIVNDKPYTREIYAELERC